MDTLNHDRTITHKIITGDFNIYLIKFNHHTTTEEYLEMLLQNNFLPTILLPTRVTSHTCTLIDHIHFSTSKHRDQFMSGNLLTDMSDHFANFFVLYSNKKNDKKKKDQWLGCSLKRINKNFKISLNK